MSRLFLAALSALLCVAASRTIAAGASPPPLEPVPHDAQTALVERYLRAMQGARYEEVYALLVPAARAYYRNAENLRSVYAADAYRMHAFTLLGTRGDGALGRVFFARESAQFRDHAHDFDLDVTATVPVGVVDDGGRLYIKDPGHPWRAFASDASSSANGVRAVVRKMSFFPRRIEAVISIVNMGHDFVTVLPYGKSVLRDSAGRAYRPIETRDWSLTDKTFFEGLRLAPNAQYTGTLAFVCDPLGNARPTYELTLAPLLVDGADAPFMLEVEGIAAVAEPAPSHT